MGVYILKRLFSIEFEQETTKLGQNLCRFMVCPSQRDFTVFQRCKFANAINNVPLNVIDAIHSKILSMWSITDIWKFPGDRPR